MFSLNQIACYIVLTSLFYYPGTRRDPSLFELTSTAPLVLGKAHHQSKESNAVSAFIASLSIQNASLEFNLSKPGLDTTVPIVSPLRLDLSALKGFRIPRCPAQCQNAYISVHS